MNHQNFISALDNKSSLTVAKYYQDISTMDIICVDAENCQSFVFNPTTGLWQEMGINQIAVSIQVELYADLERRSGDAGTYNRGKEYKALLKSIGDLQFCLKVTKTYLAKREDKKFLDIFDSNRNVFNFKNGLVDLRTGEFRQRTKTDYITKCLHYDYKENIDPKMKERILDILTKICNDSKEDLNDLLRWEGYCLTGHTKEQKCMFHIGHKASNGKSTSLKMYSYSFPIYCFKLDSETFNVNYSMRHKQFANLRAPVRKCYIEEQDGKSLDVKVLKNFVDGDKENLNVMFGISIQFDIHAKLECTSNKLPKFQTDNGVGRRGLCIEHRNSFVEKKDYDKLEDKTGFYLVDRSTDDFVKDPEFGITYFNILLPYAKEYYKNGLKLSDKTSEEFKVICDDNDKFKEFIEEHFIQTTNEDDKIHKDEMLQVYRQYTNFHNTDFQYILNELKRLRMKYNRQARKKGFVKQGCVTHLKFREEKQEDEEAYNIQDSEEQPKKEKVEHVFVERKVEVIPDVDTMLRYVFEHYDMNPKELIQMVKERYPIHFEEPAKKKTVTVKGKKEKESKKKDDEDELDDLEKEFAELCK